MAKRRRGAGRTLTDEERVSRDMATLMRAAGFSSMEELARRAAADDGADLVFDDVDLSDLAFDDLAGPTTAPAPSTDTKPIALPPVSGTRSVTIRVKAWVLRDFKAQAEKTGVPYQRLMNRALADAAGRFYK